MCGRRNPLPIDAVSSAVDPPLLSHDPTDICARQIPRPLCDSAPTNRASAQARAQTLPPTPRFPAAGMDLSVVGEQTTEWRCRGAQKLALRVPHVVRLCDEMPRAHKLNLVWTVKIGVNSSSSCRSKNAKRCAMVIVADRRKTDRRLRLDVLRPGKSAIRTCPVPELSSILATTNFL